MDLFYRCLAKTSVSQTVENVHRLRVAIKGIRSLLVLMDKACAGALQKRDHLKIYAPLFRKAGQVRDIQISLGLLKSKKTAYLVPYKKYLGRILKVKTRHLHAETLVIDLKQLDKLNHELVNKIQNIHPGSIPQSAASLIQRLLGRVYSLSQKPRDVKTLHDIRIILKTVQESLEILLRIKPSQDWKAVDRKLKPMYDALGKWHDEALLIKSIKAYQHSSGSVNGHLTRLASRLEKENKTREDKIYALLRKLLPPFRQKGSRKAR
ncbi:MAG TPA: CHAD domain-containing protein [Saprospiraceae bacterium]|nr:CHAD domain-containing protein [Saprospiraceae bacterium]